MRLHLQEVWISFVDQGFVADPGSKPSHATSHIILLFLRTLLLATATHRMIEVGGWLPNWVLLLGRGVSAGTCWESGNEKERRKGEGEREVSRRESEGEDEDEDEGEDEDDDKDWAQEFGSNWPLGTSNTWYSWEPERHTPQKTHSPPRGLD